jgi:hypothetical protein
VAERAHALVVVHVAGDQRQTVHQRGRGDHWIGPTDRRSGSFERAADGPRKAGFFCSELEDLEGTKPCEVGVELVNAPGLL